MATRDEARQRRSDARTRRRAAVDGRKNEEPREPSEPAASSGDSAQTIKDAAKVAAAAAAFGAAIGGARALFEHLNDRNGDGDSEPASDAPPVAEQEPAATFDPAADVEAEAPTDDAPEEAPEHVAERDRVEQQSTPDAFEQEGVSGDEALRIVDEARAQLRALHGADAESVSSLERQRGGWRVGLEVVEVHRIPESTDVLATYEVLLDDDANLIGLSRGRRYHRAQAGDGEGA